MTSTVPPDLRALVQEVIREIVGESKAKRPTTAPSPASTPTRRAAAEPDAAPSTFAAEIGVTPTGPADASGRQRTESVRLTNDVDLAGFVSMLLRLFENPKSRADLRTGRLRFRLVGSTAGTAGAVHRVERGVVTERQLAAIAEAGGRLVLGPGAVLTPLAREKARALGVPFEKERR
ncbi:hypothetical protein [Nocardia sp. NPDC051981]|uniref:hypothetical protein n=1 Tax=Nocardia sp. NPDC051981 TaxID=3155417 RepID=UPI003414EBAB